MGNSQQSLKIITTKNLKKGRIDRLTNRRVRPISHPQQLSTAWECTYVGVTLLVENH
ncbi:hypothetical protein An03g02730 [Aspergillus niger]|uniref:Uncharacterized protein n=2 Tax=Aspergillus niger TaxID=5061 RepID=A2QGD1_ASPNC|nr:hypothetical protein An03g02730 [Aspergillus niger]CAK44578.1 hypothetical protein An03g02730 [Aspergillus niger]